MRYKALIALLAIAFACQSGNIFARGGRHYGRGRRVENVEWRKVKVWTGSQWIIAYVRVKKANPGRPAWTPLVIPPRGRVAPHESFERRKVYPGHPHYVPEPPPDPPPDNGEPPPDNGEPPTGGQPGG